ncbi:hypothetical protein FSST1_000235 [Fusarium sambucinum]
MEPLEPKSDKRLGIRLDSDTYAPGDTITGFAYRATPISTPNAQVLCCLHGGASVVSKHDATIDSSFDFLTCHGESSSLYNGPLNIGFRSHERWSFSIEIPTCADSTINMGNTSATYAPVGTTDHQLPPTYTLCSPGVISAYVQYFVVVKLIYGGSEQVEELQAGHPFRMVQYSPNPPIADFAIRVWRYPKSIKSNLLIPGMEEEKISLFGWKKRSMSRSHDPTFKYELLFGFPTRIQMDNPTPIPLRLVVFPNWEKTTEIIQNVPQQFTLLFIKVSLVTCTKVIAKCGREKFYTRAVDLCLSKAMDRLHKEVLIPCVSRWDPVDVGEMLNLHLGLTQVGFNTSYPAEKCTPSFRTYNMTVTHKLQWILEAKVAGQVFSAKGEANVLLLRSSDEREHSTQGQNAYEIGRTLDTELGLFEAEEDDSWIRPPPEDDAPPSFADAIVMDRIIEPRR